MNNNKISIFKALLHDNLSITESDNKNKKMLLQFIDSLANGKDMDDSFFSDALKHIRNEIGNIIFPECDNKEERLKEYWNILFPEGNLYFQDHNDVISSLRDKRSLTIKSLNLNPIQNIPKEMTFTSNVLLTIPNRETDLEKLDLPEEIRKELPSIMDEKQLYWFDHPVQIGEIREKNEIIYGLKGLSEAFKFEKQKGKVGKDATLDVLLSVSVTHEGLQRLASPYLKYELSQSDDIQDLNVYIFTESSSKEILDAYSDHSESISQYFGVDGKYGRHYNFLKAINVLWKLVRNPKLKGTFKIDLDQIFPQKELVEYTGKSAFEHFQSPLWGASATDTEGNSVDLSMIAGALVNEKDIHASLFTPDVSIPNLDAPLNDLAFFKHLSMSLSTRAELMTRYTDDNELDGKNKAISRIHVTGGTNGILIDALSKYRPFTPSFIGRAEDQAYILSVLNQKSESRLRYYHEDGLIMRHDKEAFAGESIKAAKDGTYIADIMRILYYSYFAAALPGGLEAIKEMTFPFTGSYISHYPTTLSYMRLVFKILEMYEEGLDNRADAMLKLGESRLQPLIASLDRENFLIEEYEKEKRQWNKYYDELETLNGSSEKIEKINSIFDKCHII